MTAKHQITRRLTQKAAAQIDMLTNNEIERLEEIRFRVDRPMELMIAGKSRLTGYSPDSADMERLISALSGYALYGCEEQMAKGFLPLPGGHRAGVCGDMTAQDGRYCMARVTSICIRVARVIRFAAQDVIPHLFDEKGGVRNILLLGPPGCGKTTVLRDLIMLLSEDLSVHVAVVDERGEMGDLLVSCTYADILGGIDKAHAAAMLIRSMAPQVIVMDEIGVCEDAAAICDAVRGGVAVLATAHAGSYEDAVRRPLLSKLADEHVFDRYILLGPHAVLCGVWDRYGKRIQEEKNRGNKKCGCGSNASGQCDRLSAL